MANRKYEFTGDTKMRDGHTLHRIRAIVTFASVVEGEIGGWIESERNLSYYGNAWVSGNAEVFGDAYVSGNAYVSGDAWVSGNAEVFGNAYVSGNARVSGNADYLVFKNCWSSMRWFTYTRSNKKWKAGCFLGTGEELIKKAYKDSYRSGKCYEAIVRAVEAIENEMKDKEAEDGE